MFFCGDGGFCSLQAGRPERRQEAPANPAHGGIHDRLWHGGRFVALCKGVMYSIAPELRIVDLTHQVTPFSILDGARFLYGATPYFPAGTVFVVVIDPGVGSTRKAVVVKSKRGQYFVLPDNGLMTLVQDRDGIEAAREITNRDWMIGAAMSSTFHGRDIFSPVGAHLAHGEDWTQVGPEMAVNQLVRLDVALPGSMRRD